MPDTHSTQNDHPWSRHSSSRRSISKRPASAAVRALGRTRRAVTAHAGAVLLRNVMEALGLVSMTDARASLKRAVGSRGSRRGNSLPRVLERSAWCALSGRPGGCTGGPGARDLARLRRAGATNGGDVAAPLHPRPHPRVGQGAGGGGGHLLPSGRCGLGDARLRRHLRHQRSKAQAGCRPHLQAGVCAARDAVMLCFDAAFGAAVHARHRPGRPGRPRG